MIRTRQPEGIDECSVAGSDGAPVVVDRRPVGIKAGLVVNHDEDDDDDGDGGDDDGVDHADDCQHLSSSWSDDCGEVRGAKESVLGGADSGLVLTSLLTEDWV